jgi:phosphoribosylamine---glycine ligase
LIGNGGRENALAWKIHNSGSFIKTNSKLYNTTGNPGINKFAEPVNIQPTEINSLADFCLKEKIDFTVVGPEIPLSMGIVNEFEKNGLRIFGPCCEAAEIESSKVFAKKLMNENNIPTAKHRAFSGEDLNKAKEYFDTCSYPVVIKADGLAAGKGVIIADNFDTAMDTLKEISTNHIFGEAGINFIAEEFLEGEEVSVFVITDSQQYVILPFSQDHKKISEGEKGKNTGGMGAIAPLKKFMNEALEKKIRLKIIEPVLKALRNSGRGFRGCLYCGLMISDDEPFVIEFNCRFGDPETQAVLPLIKSDFLQLLIAASDPSKSELKNYSLELNDIYTCCVVLASGGYPGKYETGKKIIGLEDVKNNSLIFHSGTKFGNDIGNDKGEIFSSGGRVLSVVGISEKSLEDAVRNAYENVDAIDFENKYYRKDIGFRQLAVNS